MELVPVAFRPPGRTRLLPPASNAMDTTIIGMEVAATWDLARKVAAALLREQRYFQPAPPRS